MVHEQSASTVGLTHRWIIKGIYAAGLWLVVLGILSVLLRVIVFLFGGRSQAEVDLQIGATVSRMSRPPGPGRGRPCSTGWPTISP